MFSDSKRLILQSVHTLYFLLTRKVMTKDILLRYLIREKASGGVGPTKDDMVERIINIWTDEDIEEEGDVVITDKPSRSPSAPSFH